MLLFSTFLLLTHKSVTRTVNHMITYLSKSVNSSVANKTLGFSFLMRQICQMKI